MYAIRIDRKPGFTSRPVTVSEQVPISAPNMIATPAGNEIKPDDARLITIATVADED